jgi:hypothetical protein
MQDTQPLHRLLVERERLTRSLREHDRSVFVLRIASLVALCLFAVWAVFAWDAGAIDFVTMGWALPLAFALAFILTREFRFQGKVVSVFEMMMLLSGQYIWARDDPDTLRRDLVDCEAKIAELQIEDPEPGRL